MILVQKLENIVAKLFKPLPHLPTKFRKCIANNIWWIIAVTVISVIICTFLMTGCACSAMTLLIETIKAGGSCTTSTCTSSLVLGSLVSTVLMILTVILMLMAILPLKYAQKEGWELLFCAAVLKTIIVIIEIFSIYSAIKYVYATVVGAACILVCLYVLFEIRSFFRISAKASNSSDKK